MEIIRSSLQQTEEAASQRHAFSVCVVSYPVTLGLTARNVVSHLRTTSRLLYHRPNLLRFQRHINRLDAQRGESIQHCIDNRGRCSDTASLAHSFRAERIEQ